MGTAVEAAPSVVRGRVPRAVRRKRRLVAVFENSLLIALAIAFLAPIAFMLLTGLMTDRQSLSSDLWPDTFQFSNFTEVFHKAPLLSYARNTFLYATLSTIGVLVSSVPVAYALACVRWRGRNVVFALVLISMMLPPQVMIVRLCVLLSKRRLVGTIWPLIIPNWFGDA